MLHRKLLCLAVALIVLEGSQAFAADVITLRCDFPQAKAHYNNVVADQRGISITSYTRDDETGKLQYVRNYTENKKDDSSETYYRINSAEIT